MKLSDSLYAKGLQEAEVLTVETQQGRRESLPAVSVCTQDAHRLESKALPLNCKRLLLLLPSDIWLRRVNASE